MNVKLGEKSPVLNIKCKKLQKELVLGLLVNILVKSTRSKARLLGFIVCFSYLSACDLDDLLLVKMPLFPTTYLVSIS